MATSDHAKGVESVGGAPPHVPVQPSPSNTSTGSPVGNSSAAVDPALSHASRSAAAPAVQAGDGDTGSRQAAGSIKANITSVSMGVEAAGARPAMAESRQEDKERRVPHIALDLAAGDAVPAAAVATAEAAAAQVPDAKEEPRAHLTLNVEAGHGESLRPAEASSAGGGGERSAGPGGESSQQGAAPASGRTCWICLCGTEEGELTQPCNCRELFSHPMCLARWQIRQHGREDEVQCRLCKAPLPPWPASLADEVPLEKPKEPTVGGLTRRQGACMALGCLSLVLCVMGLVMAMFSLRWRGTI